MPRIIKILLFSFLLQSLTLYAQDQDDTLKKYSYLIKAMIPDSVKVVNGVTYSKWMQCTGFLITEKGKIYLVSAAHSLLGVRDGFEPPAKHPTVFYLFVKKLNSEERVMVEIDLTGRIPKSDSSYFKTNPDFYCVQLDIPPIYELNTINSFFSKDSTDYDKAYIALMYGYPEKSYVDSCNRVVLKMDNYFTPVHPEDNPTESDAALRAIDGLHGSGDSGAPLFLKLGNSKVIFGGICVATFKDNIIFIRPELLYRALKNL